MSVHIISKAFRDQFDEVYGRLLLLEVENRHLRRANAILALPRVTEAQLLEAERALRRILELDDAERMHR